MSGISDLFFKAISRIVVACVVCYALGLIVARYWVPLLFVVLLVAGGRYLWWRSGR